MLTSLIAIALTVPPPSHLLGSSRALRDEGFVVRLAYSDGTSVRLNLESRDEAPLLLEYALRPGFEVVFVRFDSPRVRPVDRRRLHLAPPVSVERATANRRRTRSSRVPPTR